MKRIAIIGAGVSGLTCGVAFAERGHRVAIFADEIGRQTTSGAAAAIWWPYDAEPAGKIVPWALATYKALADLARDALSGVSMIELRTFSRAGQVQIPNWAPPLGARLLVMANEAEASLRAFVSGFVVKVPLMDTAIYLDYLARRIRTAGGEINGNVRFEKLEDIDLAFDLLINCAGVGAKMLVGDSKLEPHRGQIAVVSKIENLPYTVVCDDLPLTYVIPRTNDCVFGGTNESSSDRRVDPVATERIVTECCRVLDIGHPNVLDERVGLRPFRKSGVRLESDRARDGRSVIHNYGHGGSGFTVSWGCAQSVLDLARDL